MPSSAAASTPCRLWMDIWVLACRGMSGRYWRMAAARPRSWMMMPSAPTSEASLAVCKRGLHLPVVDQGVERHIDLAAADMAVAHGALVFLIGEILCAAPGVEVAHAHIDGVRAVLHRGDHSLGRAGGREQFHHVSVCAPFVMEKILLLQIKYRVIITQCQVLRQGGVHGIIPYCVNKP